MQKTRYCVFEMFRYFRDCVYEFIGLSVFVDCRKYKRQRQTNMIQNSIEVARIANILPTINHFIVLQYIIYIDITPQERSLS